MIRFVRFFVLVMTLGCFSHLTGCQEPTTTRPADDDTQTASAPAPADVTPVELADQAPENQTTVPLDSPADTPQEETPAQLPTSLTIGDPAPPLVIGEWMTGDPIESMELGDVLRTGLPSNVSPVLSVAGRSLLNVNCFASGRRVAAEVLGIHQSGKADHE